MALTQPIWKHLSNVVYSNSNAALLDSTRTLSISATDSQNFKTQSDEIIVELIGVNV